MASDGILVYLPYLPGPITARRSKAPEARNVEVRREIGGGEPEASGGGKRRKRLGAMRGRWNAGSAAPANWRGRPLISRMAVVELIAATSTVQGLALRAELDETLYQTGRKVSDEEMAALSLERCDFHGEWNYLLSPRPHPEP